MERNHVCLETAQKLKAAGFPQDKTMLCWAERMWSKPIWMVDTRNYSEKFTQEQIAAPTAEEIAAMLPAEDSDGGLTIEKYLDGSWHADYYFYDMPRYSMHNYPTMAEALAALWLKLQEVEQLREARQLNGEPKQ